MHSVALLLHLHRYDEKTGELSYLFDLFVELISLACAFASRVLLCRRHRKGASG